MNEFRRLFLLSALTGLAGVASLAFAPALAGAALPIHSATDTLRAVAAASYQAASSAGPHLSPQRRISAAAGARPRI